MSQALFSCRILILKHFRSLSWTYNNSSVKLRSMEICETLDDLDRNQLLAKIKSLQQQCNSLKAENSRYEAMNQKFLKVSSARKRKQKVFLSQTTFQRKIALKVSYFGWDYMGLQDNPGLTDTIEKILFLALRHTKLLVADLENAEYSKCGRTDRGVSAFSQVFCLKLRSKNEEDSICSNKPCRENTASDEKDDKCALPVIDPTSDHTMDSTSSTEELDYCGILNRVLPVDIQVTGWAYAEDSDFSARHKCVGRIYKYYFPRGTLDITAMDVASKKLIGSHDFRNFCKINVGERLVYVRELRDFKITTVSLPELDVSYNGPMQMCEAIISGTGFLYHQVRYMMSILFLIGMGLENPDIIDDLLNIDKTPRRPQYGLTVNYPLVLYDCKFDTLKWNLSNEAGLRLKRTFQQYWLSATIKSALARSMLDKFNEDFHAKGNENHLEYENISRYLLQENWSAKQYRQVMKRQTGNSLEEKIESLENKRKRKLERAEADE